MKIFPFPECQVIALHWVFGTTFKPLMKQSSFVLRVVDIIMNKNEFLTRGKWKFFLIVNVKLNGLWFTWQHCKRGPFGPHIRTMSYVGRYPPPRYIHKQYKLSFGFMYIIWIRRFILLLDFELKKVLLPPP